MAKMNFQSVKKEKQDFIRGLRECGNLKDFDPLIAQCEKAKKKWDSSTIECTPKQSQELVKLDGQLALLMKEKKAYFLPQIQKKQREAMVVQSVVKTQPEVVVAEVNSDLIVQDEIAPPQPITHRVHPDAAMMMSHPNLLRKALETAAPYLEAARAHRLKSIQTIRDHLSCLAKKLEQYKSFPGEDYQAVSLAVTRIYGGLNPMVIQYLEGGVELKLFKTNAEMFLQTQETQKDIETLNTPRGWKAKTIVSNIILALATLLVGYGVGMLVTGRFALFQPKTDAGNKMDKISSAIDQLSV